MSSEEMRIDLEMFVNVGLEEGWHGWPLKAEACQAPRSGSRLHAVTEETDHKGRDNWPLFASPHQGFASRLFDWERGTIWAGARVVSQESRS